MTESIKELEARIWKEVADEYGKNDISSRLEGQRQQIFDLLGNALTNITLSEQEYQRRLRNAKGKRHDFLQLEENDHPYQLHRIKASINRCEYDWPEDRTQENPWQQAIRAKWPQLAEHARASQIAHNTRRAWEDQERKRQHAEYVASLTPEQAARRLHILKHVVRYPEGANPYA